MSAPRAITASTFPADARRTASGSSKEPGTFTRLISFSCTPCRRRASSAPSTRRSVMKLFNREATIATFKPCPWRSPSIVRTISPPLFHAQDVPHFLLLGPQVLDVRVVGRDRHGGTLGHSQAVPPH